MLILTSDPNPSANIIKKKRIDHKGGTALIMLKPFKFYLTFYIKFFSF